MPTQLRLYTIEQDSLRQFAAEWKAEVLPLRLAQGFHIQDAWIVEETSQFAWLLRYDGAEGWEAKERAYYASSERAKMAPDPARLIVKAEEYFVESVL